MFGWLRKASTGGVRAVPELRPEDFAYPFAFPVLALSDSVWVHRDPLSLGLTSEDAALSGNLRGFAVYSADRRQPFRDIPLDRTDHVSDSPLLRVWHPTGISAIARTERSLFGKRLVNARYEFAGGEPFDLQELRGKLRSLVEHDDDALTQFMDCSELLQALERATTFADLVAVIDAAYGETQDRS